MRDRDAETDGLSGAGRGRGGAIHAQDGGGTTNPPQDPAVVPAPPPPGTGLGSGAGRGDGEGEGDGGGTTQGGGGKD